MPKASGASAKARAAAARSQEKRLFPYRKACPRKLLDRLHRAATQRLYLIQRCEEGPHEVVFSVLGSTGNVYHVTLSHLTTCTCPDFLRKQDLCKHAIFVLTRVLGLDAGDPLAFQRAYLTPEVEQLIALARRRQVGGGVLANERVRESFGKGSEVFGDDAPAPAPRLRRTDMEECPICFDPLGTDGAPGASATTHCAAVCGAAFHRSCIHRWLAQQQRAATCPNCRSPWPSEGGPAVVASSRTNGEGYLNLGGLQGQSSVRDYSTYYSSRSHY